MKIRLGHVSNSSSSSFTILKSDLTQKQIDQIKNHIELSRTEFKDQGSNWKSRFNENNWHNGDGEEWDIEETEDKLNIGTTMDNFDMWRFLELIGVEKEKLQDYEGDDDFCYEN